MALYEDSAHGHSSQRGLQLGGDPFGLPVERRAEFRAAVNRETEPAKVRAMLAAFFLPAVDRQAA